MKILLILTSFFTLINSCRILSLSGGGVLGAFEIGVVSHLAEKRGVEWDLLTGVSAGSINVASLSTVLKGDIKKHTEEFKNVWTNVTSDQVFVFNYFMNGLSLLDSKPFINTLRNMFKDKIPLRPVLISATSLNRGKAVIFDQFGILFHGFVNVLMASTAIPVVFQPHVFQNEIFVDGGITSNIIVNEGINWCKKFYPDERIHIDAVIVSQIKNVNFGLNLTFGEVTSKTLDIIKEQVLYSELLHHVNDENIDIYIYEPKTKTNVSILDFGTTKKLWKEGYTFSNVRMYKL